MNCMEQGACVVAFFMERRNRVWFFTSKTFGVPFCMTLVYQMACEELIISSKHIQIVTLANILAVSSQLRKSVPRCSQYNNHHSLHAERFLSRHCKSVDIDNHMGLFVGLTYFSYQSYMSAPLRVGMCAECMFHSNAYNGAFNYIMQTFSKECMNC